MRKTLLIGILAMLSACAGAHSGTGREMLAVSIEPQRKILEELAGDLYDICVVLPSGANPENYDPTMSQRIDVNRSGIFFTTGHLPFETAIASTLSEGTEVVDTSTGIAPVSGTHGHAHGDGHSHGHADAADPHVWASVRGAKQIAANMAATLSAHDPEHAELYRQRYGAMAQRLDSLDSALAQQLAAAGTRAFAVWHPSLSYYARDYGLHQISVGHESKEISLPNMRALVDEARADSVEVFFFQKEYDMRQAENLNREIGSRLVTINPLAYDWEAELSNITDELTR